MSPKLRLDEEQRQQLYSEICTGYMEHGARPRKVKRAVRERLVSMGWETILIQLALQYILPLLMEWIRKKIEPPSVMPVGFAEDEPPEVELTTAEASFLMVGDDDPEDGGDVV